jgi:hypothetical protein
MRARPLVSLLPATSLLALAACVRSATPAAMAPPAGGTAAESAPVLAVVGRLFDAMRAGDSAGVRAAFDPGARLVTVGERDGAPVVRSEPIDEFVRAVGTPHAERWDERVWDTRVFVDGRLASVWTPYAFYVGERLSHCGADSFQLVNGAEGWKIVFLADTRQRERCAPPTTAR